MSAVIQRFKLLFIAMSLILVGLMAWLIISRQHANKIPSRGVFVVRQVIH